MSASSDWDLWAERWRAERVSPAELDALIARTKRARRGIVMMRLVSTGVTVLALGVVGAALWHAGNAFEAALGLAVGVGIVVVWLVDVLNQRDSRHHAEAPTAEYRRARRGLCLRQIRFARLGWTIVALDLVFLIPWWIGGIAVHGRGFHLTQLLTMWGPLALMSAFVVWTISLTRSARAELRRLAVQEPDT
jgi:hypothetical protein